MKNIKIILLIIMLCFAPISEGQNNWNKGEPGEVKPIDLPLPPCYPCPDTPKGEPVCRWIPVWVCVEVGYWCIGAWIPMYLCERPPADSPTKLPQLPYDPNRN